MKYLIAIVLLFLCLSCSREIQKQNTTLNKIQIAGLDYKTNRIGKPAPDFEVKTLEGKTLKSSKLKDRVVILYVSYTGYERPTDELNNLNEMVEKYKDAPVEFLAIYCYDSEEKVRKSLLTFPLKFQQIANALQIAKSYKFPPIYPTLITIDKNKIITEIVYAADKGALADVEISINKAIN